jgi:hypothetical protein
VAEVTQADKVAELAVWGLEVKILDSPVVSSTEMEATPTNGW